ncbi:MAG: hypothetical protein KIT80_19625 [Chitinophagaceae bacterium]|nr:hypothetical protein [Chitinophagaceae bacterium]MCW5929139.1 hypothetical protein [Chitinophagaceae bacterium]
MWNTTGAAHMRFLLCFLCISPVRVTTDGRVISRQRMDVRKGTQEINIRSENVSSKVLVLSVAMHQMVISKQYHR